MPFNPAVTDRSADYIFEGMQTQMKMNEAQKIRDQEMTQKNIGQAMESLGQLAGQFKADATKTAAVDGRTNAVVELAKKNPEIVDPEFAAALLKEPNRDKRAGMLLTMQELMPLRQRQALSVQEHQAQLSKEALANQNDRTGQTATVTDPVTGQKVGLYYQNNRQVAPFKMPATTGVTGVQKVDLGGGAYAYFDSKGNPVPKSAVMQDDQNPADALRVSGLKQKLAALDGQMAGDPTNQKPGPDWWPFSQTFKQQRAATAAELGTLEQGQTAGSTGDGVVKAAPTQAAANPVVKSKAEFDALPSGTTYIGADGKKYRKP